MLYRSALTRELAQTTAAVLTVLVAIGVVTLFIRILGDVARGQIANEAVFAFLGFSLVHFLPVLMIIALFIGVLLPLARMWRDSEMAIWFNSGLSIANWIRPVLGFAVPYVLVILAITAVLNPWAQLKKAEYRQELKSRGDAALIAPGMFVESGIGDRVYFVGAMNPLTGLIKNVFMQSTQDGRLGVTAAHEGRYLQLEDGSRYLVLDGGRRYEGVAGSLEYRIVEFARYWMRLDPVEADAGDMTLGQTDTLRLARNPQAEARAELLWRVGLPLTALVLALAAIPLSFVNTRARRSYGLVLSLLLYFLYNNLLSLAQAWVAQGKLDPWVGMFGPHLLMGAGVLLLFRARSRGFTRRKALK